MQHNDLTNDGFLRSIVVFDGFLGLPTAVAPTTLLDKILKRKHPISWEINPPAVEFVNRLPWTTDTSVEIATFEGRNQLSEIEDLLDEANVYYQDLYASSLAALASECGWNTTIAHVYHADRTHWLAYGPKGKYVGA